MTSQAYGAPFTLRDHSSADAATVPVQRSAASVAEGPPLVVLAERQMRAASSSLYVRLGKPVIDRVVALVLSVVLLPLMATVAAAVLLGLGRPLLFRQERIGLDGRRFSVVKFRTMMPDRRSGVVPAQPDRRLTHKTSADPRHVPLGSFLRRWSLDELPQLFNVLRGDMSLVGPRPELPVVVSRYEPWQHLRHLVKPGITGWWQVSARGNAPMHERVDVDLEYVMRPTLARDVRILATTLPAALLHRGS